MKIINLSGRQLFNPVKEGANVLEVLAAMKKGASRVPVMNERDGKITKIISQSSIVKWLAEHSEEMNKALIEKSIGDTNIGLKVWSGGGRLTHLSH